MVGLDHHFVHNPITCELTGMAHHAPAHEVIRRTNQMDQTMIKAKWFNKDKDIRWDKYTTDEILKFIKENKAKSVVMADRIIGCPHEEGIDYPENTKCTKCPYWANRDRLTGKIIFW